MRESIFVFGHYEQFRPEIRNLLGHAIEIVDRERGMVGTHVGNSFSRLLTFMGQAHGLGLLNPAEVVMILTDAERIVSPPEPHELAGKRNILL